MAGTVSSLIVKIGADIRELRSAMKTASKSIQDAGKEMTSLGKTVSKRVTAPLVALGGLALKQAADFERLRVAMDNLNGSAEEGARNFERLKEFSAGTPFQLTDLAKAQNMLQGFGMEADNAFQSIKMIGDIAAITGGSIDGIGIAFGQAAAEGRLMTQDVRQLINQGVPAIKMLADTMGVAENQVLDLASQGKISFEVLQQAFRDATSEGGMFANGMAKQSQTLSGLFSTLKDNISIAMSEMGDAIAEAFNLREIIPSLVGHIQTAIAWFASLSQDARKNMVMIGAAIAAIGPTIVALGVTITGLGVIIAALTSPIALVVGAIAGIATAFVYVRENFEAFKERFSDIGWWRNAIIDMVQFLIEYSPISLMIKQMNGLIGFFSDAQIPNPFEGISASLEGLKGETKEYKNEFGSLREAFLNTIRDFTGIDLANMFTPVTQETELARRSVEGVRVSTNKLGADMSLFREVAVPAVKTVTHSMNGLRQASAFAMDVANSFTSSFGQGMANVVVQGEKLVDTLKNIGKLLASAVIQKGLSVLLTGGLGGSGFFGSVGGLFGKIFGVGDALITSGGDVVKFNSADDILASKNMDKVIGGGGGYQRVEVFGTLRGTDLFVSSSRGGEEYGR